MANIFERLRLEEDKIENVRLRLNTGKLHGKFNLDETQELITALDKGGYFLKVSKNTSEPVVVLKSEEDSTFSVLCVLNNSTSNKIRTIYNRPIKFEFSTFSLRSLIADWC